MNSCYSLLSHMPLFFRCTAPTILTTILNISWHSEAELLRWRRQTTSLARYIHIWSSPCPCNTTSNCIPLPSNQVAKRCYHGGTFGSSSKLCPARVLRRLANGSFSVGGCMQHIVLHIWLYMLVEYACTLMIDVSVYCKPSLPTCFIKRKPSP